MNIKELREEIENQAFAVNKAKSRGIAVNQEKERMRNILMNRVDEIVEALKYAETQDVRIEHLAVEVESADQELQEKDKEIAELKKLKGKGKKQDGEQ